MWTGYRDTCQAKRSSIALGPIEIQATHGPYSTLISFIETHQPPHSSQHREMAEPQPPNVHEGIDAEDDAPPPPAAAEDRKAAAAMSSLENRHHDDEDEANQKQNKTVDQAELSAAINRLELQDSSKGKDKGKSAAEKKRDEKKQKELEEKAKRAKVKVDQADVLLLVSRNRRN